MSQTINQSAEFTQEKPQPFFSPSSHSFNVGVALTTKSTEAAVIFNHILFWLQYNKQKSINQHDDRTWMYQTILEMAAHFPYLSEQQIKDALAKLVTHKYLIKSSYSKNKFDRTNWYAVTDEDWLDIQKMFSKRSIDPIERATGPDAHLIYKKDNITHNEEKEGQAPPIPPIFSKSAKKKTDKNKPDKISYRENILLTEEQYQKLLQQDGQSKLDWKLDHMSMKKAAKGYKYDSDYHVLLPANWVEEAYQKARDEGKIHTPISEQLNRDISFKDPAHKNKKLCEAAEKMLSNLFNGNVFFQASSNEAILINKNKDIEKKYVYNSYDPKELKETLLRDLDSCFPNARKILTGDVQEATSVNSLISGLAQKFLMPEEK